MNKVKDYVALYKASAGCRRCGYNKNTKVLHFAHRDPSTKYRDKNGKPVDPSNMFKTGDSKIGSRYGEQTIWAEIAKCDVLCANCHGDKSQLERIRRSEKFKEERTGKSRYWDTSSIDFILKSLNHIFIIG